MTFLVAQQRQQLELRAASGLRRAQDVALAALLDVEAGQREPVGRGRDGVDPLAGRRAGRHLGDQQADARRAPPRPIRPRSWCSCETPNRSASITTITVAFGTSTPTSITVVATRTSIRPAANSVIVRSFSSGVSRPCSAASRSPCSGPSAQHRQQVADGERRTAALGLLVGQVGVGQVGLELGHVRADARADHVGLPAGGDLLADPLPRPAPATPVSRPPGRPTW